MLLGEDTYRNDALFAENYCTRSISVRHGSLKLIGELDETLTGFVKHELFDLERDPLGKVNVFDTRQEAGELVAMLTAYVASRSTGEAFSLSDLTREEQEEFRALGYIE